MMRQPGHRFFFFPEEVEPLGPNEPASDSRSAVPKILVAGIGNIFLGDDGFGVEVANRLAGRSLPEGVRIVDFGIRGLDLAYALMNGPEVTILIDACPRDSTPGTLYVIEPDLTVFDSPNNTHSVVDAHAMNPMNVLAMAKSMGAPLKRLLLVGCQPATLGPDDGQLGLSDIVERAVDPAVALTESLVARIMLGEWPLTIDDNDQTSPEKGSA